MRIACFGDSLTRGQFSFNWVAKLSNVFKNYTFINLGVNGELAYHLLNRIGKVKKCNPDIIFILVGTNDIFSITSKANTKRYIRNAKLPQVPTKDWYEKNLEQIIAELRKTKAKIILITIPPLGEDTNHFANQWVIEYNKIVMQLAKKYSCDILDFYEKMVNYLKENPSKKVVPLNLGLEFIIKAILKRKLLFKSWNNISKSFGLTLTTDTIHLNKTSGNMLTELTSEYLNKLK